MYCSKVGMKYALVETLLNDVESHDLRKYGLKENKLRPLAHWIFSYTMQ